MLGLFLGLAMLLAKLVPDESLQIKVDFPLFFSNEIKPDAACLFEKAKASDSSDDCGGLEGVRFLSQQLRKAVAASSVVTD